MRVLAFEIEDEDVLDRWFNENAPPLPIENLGEEHGKLIFDGHPDHFPDAGDLFVVGGEYAIVCRVYKPLLNTVELIVHRRHFDKDLEAS